MNKFKIQVRSKQPSHKILRNELKKDANKLPFRAVVRFGSKTELTDGKKRVECNTIDSINNTSNKEQMKILFIKNDIPSPDVFLIRGDKSIQQITKDGVVAVKDNKIEFPIIAKRKYHQRGIGMHKIDTQEELNTFLNSDEFKQNSYHFEKFFSGSQEFRLHASPHLDQEIFAVKKVRHKDEKDELPWHFHLNEGAFLKDFEKPKNWDEIVKVAKNSVKSLGLDIGAVDIRTNKDCSKIMAIEVNSAPGMGDLTSHQYVNGLKEIIIKKHNTKL